MAEHRGALRTLSVQPRFLLPTLSVALAPEHTHAPCPDPLPCSAGLGQIDHAHLRKNDPQLGMLVVKIGGPAYRIGMGGGAASSVPSGSNSADLDFNAVQVGR